MQIKEIINKEIWDSFIIKQPFYTFMNSWDWGEFNKRMGCKIFRLGFYDGASLAGLALFIKVEARRGAYLFCPYGPVFDGMERGQTPSKGVRPRLTEIMPEIIKLARKENVCFIRVSPLVESSVNNLGNFKQAGFRFAPMHVHAEDNWLLDITKSEEELLGNMRKTTRYLIKRAIKEGVKVFKNNSDEYIDKFIKMHKNHADRNNGNKYTAFSEKYIKTLFDVFPESDINLLYAEYEPLRRDGACSVSTKENIEAMLVSITYGKTAAYYLGASDIRHPKFSPADLLQWESIKKARDAGCAIYNFWGVAPDDNPKHPLAGVSLFKKGFGGYGYKLLHTHDIPLSWKYWLNWGVETVRRKRRGYYYK